MHAKFRAHHNCDLDYTSNTTQVMPSSSHQLAQVTASDIEDRQVVISETLFIALMWSSGCAAKPLLTSSVFLRLHLSKPAFFLLSFCVWYECHMHSHSLWHYYDIITSLITTVIIRSTPPSRSNKAGLKCPSVRTSVRPSVHKTFLRFHLNLVCR